MTPLVGHPEFTPGLTDPTFYSQSPNGFLRASQFLQLSGWLPTGTVPSGRAPLTLDHWRTIQFSHFLGSLPKLFTQKLHSLEELCLGGRHDSGFLIYRL